MKTAALIFIALLSTTASAHAQKPTTGYAPVNGLKMYYEIHGSGDGEPLVLLHGSFMTITNNWTPWPNAIIPLVNDFLDAKPQKQ